MHLFSQIREHPQFLSVLWDCSPKHTREICKKIILQHIFPEGGADFLEVQFAQLLHALFDAEVSGSLDLDKLLREDSLACVLSSAYGRRPRALSFARELLDPIFADPLRDLAARVDSASESYDPAALDATLRKTVREISSRIQEFPVGFVFASSAIVGALKAHLQHQPGSSLTATSAVSSVLMLRYIVPFIVQYGHGYPPAAQAFFRDLGVAVQKACSGSKFSPNHKLELLNAALAELSPVLEDALARLASSDLPVATQQNFHVEESPCAIDASELNLFVSSMCCRTTAPLPSAVSEPSVLLALKQMQMELAHHPTSSPPGQEPRPEQPSNAIPALGAQEQPRHVMDDAPFISRATFWWCNTLFKLGYSTPLTADDLWPAPPRTLCSSSVKLFENAWKLQCKEEKRGMRVLKAAWNCFGRLFVTSIILQIVWLSTALSLPSYFLRQMISFANDPDEPLLHGILYSVFMFIAQLTSVACLHNQVTTWQCRA
jgi:hypothetical protein